MSGKFDFYLSIAHNKGLCALVKRCKQKSLKVEYEYLAHNKRHRKYIESTVIDFEDYGGFLLYISELDEFKNSVDKLHGTVGRLENAIEDVSFSLRSNVNHG